MVREEFERQVVKRGNAREIRKSSWGRDKRGKGEAKARTEVCWKEKSTAGNKKGKERENIRSD